MKVLYLQQIFVLPDDFDGDLIDAAQEWVNYRREKKENPIPALDNFTLTKKEDKKYNTAIKKGIKALSELFFVKAQPLGARSFGHGFLKEVHHQKIDWQEDFFERLIDHFENTPEAEKFAPFLHEMKVMMKSEEFNK